MPAPAFLYEETVMNIKKQRDDLSTFVVEIRHIIDDARVHAVRSIDHARVIMYWSIGKRIFEKEQEGKNRADYGSRRESHYWLLLCTDKIDTAVRLTLPEDNTTILASRYQLYLPTKELFIDEINAVKRLANMNSQDDKE